ncbi:hypothetical protein BRC81_17260 [Halobacteriales archaeon QS_1_68_20]|nr:MAG: hypothetical protein BRC81_17260 [Halobacteriales archaeon QS_1_68_20]
MLAREPVYKNVIDDFPLASELADLVEREVVRCRTSDDLGRNPVLVTDGRLVVRIAAGNFVEHAATEDESFVSSVRAAYEERWAGADSFEIRTPARSRLRDSLTDDENLGEAVWEDFAALLRHVEADGAEVDEVTLTVIAAARNGSQLYHLSRWGKEVGLASKATFSRMKSQLEEQGIVETVRVPVEVGRPRQRLTLPDDLVEADAKSLVAALAE